MNNDTGLTQQIILGSKNIDRMRVEIIQVVNTMIGFLRYIRFGGGTQTYEYTSNECTWRLTVDLNGFHSGKQMLTLECWLKDGAEAVYTSFNIIRLEDVERVHRQLPLLVDELIREFPDLQRMLKPLVDASKAFQGQSAS
jgi:hypothetical protein